MSGHQRQAQPRSLEFHQCPANGISVAQVVGSSLPVSPGALGYNWIRNGVAGMWVGPHMWDSIIADGA